MIVIVVQIAKCPNDVCYDCNCYEVSEGWFKRGCKNCGHESHCDGKLI